MGSVAKDEDVWKMYESGCSVRLLHPQRWSDPLHLMLAKLERYWKIPVGCNTYLTPPHSQGFSPHYDDIDAFIIQTEGKKHWKLHHPRDQADVLARFSSQNFSQEEVVPSVIIHYTHTPYRYMTCVYTHVLFAKVFSR